MAQKVILYSSIFFFAYFRVYINLLFAECYMYLRKYEPEKKIIPEHTAPLFVTVITGIRKFMLVVKNRTPQIWQ